MFCGLFIIKLKYNFVDSQKIIFIGSVHGHTMEKGCLIITLIVKSDGMLNEGVHIYSTHTETIDKVFGFAQKYKLPLLLILMFFFFNSVLKRADEEHVFKY